MLGELVHRIAAQPVLYDWIQRMAGFEIIGQRLAPHLAASAGMSLLEVGAGTGNYRQFMPRSTNYIWTDTDPQKLEGYLAKRVSGTGAMSDATSLCFGEQSVDYALCACMSHHLADEQLTLMFRELARVVKRKLIFLDAVQGGALSGLLWRHDRGSYPRTASNLSSRIEESFFIEQQDQFAVYHRYVLCIATPLRQEVY